MIQRERICSSTVFPAMVDFWSAEPAAGTMLSSLIVLAEGRVYPFWEIGAYSAEIQNTSVLWALWPQGIENPFATFNFL